ncbi:hypothetical protein ABPG75_000443 [Micractinium tetrahymenae]
MAVVHPDLQRLLLRAQTSGKDPAATLDAAINAWERVLPAAGGDRGAATALAAAVRRLLLTSCVPAAALAALVGTSGHPAALGMLLAELLARGVVPARELLAAASSAAGEPHLLAAAVAQLHTGANAGTLPRAAAAAAAGAFDSLVKLLVTASHPPGGRSGSSAEQGQQRAAERALQHLRLQWSRGQGQDAAPQQLQQRPDGDDGIRLLAAMVDAADREAFPRQCATSWIATELSHVLRAANGNASGPANLQEHNVHGPAAAAAATYLESTAWQAAMAAFAAALPLDTLLQQVQATAWEAGLAAPRAAALLAAAAAQRPRERPAAERWVRQQASAALAQHAAGPLRSLLLLQRELLLAMPPGDGSSISGGSRRQGQQVHQEEQLPPQGQAAWYPPQLRQGLHGQPASPEQRYCAWLADTLLSGPAGAAGGAGGAAGAAGTAHSDAGAGAQQHLQFLVQQVLIPLCPEDPPRWLTAQRDTLSLLLARQGEAARQGLPPLPAGGRLAAEEYVRLTEQRLKAQQAQQAQQQTQQQAAGLAAAPSNLQKGQAIAKLLIQEWVDGRGQLLEKTIQTMLAKAANVFTRGELHNMLAPALLEPTADVEASEQRAAFMEYLYDELDSRKDSQIKHHFKPEAVRLYRRRCLHAQLEGASLEQLARRAPKLLLAPLAGSAGSGFSGSSGSISGHQLLDRVGRLVGEQLGKWSQLQQQGERQAGAQQPQQRPGSAHSVPAGPEQLAGVLLGMWTAAYSAGMVESLGPGGAGNESGDPTAAAMAAHLLSIVHLQPLLHGPLLRRLRQQLLGEDGIAAAAAGGVAAQQQRQYDARERLAAAAMLASTAGALVQAATPQGQLAGGRRGPQAADGSLAALQPLFVWRLEHEASSPASCASGSGSGMGTAADEDSAEVPGPVWLQGLLAELPLGSAAAMQRASAAAAAHLGCLRHFRCYALLPSSSSSNAVATVGSTAQQLLLRWRRPALLPAAPASYADESAGSLVFPACTSAVRLQQWLMLRLGVAQALLGCSLSMEGSTGGGSSGREAKRQRMEGWPGQPGGAAGAAEEARSPAEAVLQECGSSLQTALGAPLAAATGKLPFFGFLRLEAAAATATSGGGSDLLPPGTADAVFRLCCSLYLDRPSTAAADAGCPAAAGGHGGGLDAAALAGLVQHLVAAAAERADTQPGLARGCEEEAEVLEVIPDSEDQDAPLAGAMAVGLAAQGRPAAAEGSGTLDALAAAMAEQLVQAASRLAAHGRHGRQAPAAALAAVPTCQRAAAHMLRLLAAGRGGPTLERLLPALLACVAQQCRQQLTVQAAPPAQSSAWALQHSGQQAQQAQQLPVLLSYADEGTAAAVQQQVTALAFGLLLELLPPPASSFSGVALLRQQQARLAAMSAAVQRALDDGTAGSRPPAAAGWQHEFEAALHVV